MTDMITLIAALGLSGAYACRVDVLSWARHPILMAVHVVGGVAAVSVVAQVAQDGVTWPHAIMLLSSAALLSATYRALPRGCHDVR